MNTKRLSRMAGAVAIALPLLASCQSGEQDSAGSAGSLLVFSATHDPESPSTRTQMDGAQAHILWSAGDKINVFDSDEISYEFTTSGSGASTSFSLTDADSPSETDLWYALYPYDEDSDIRDGVITTTLKDEYTVDRPGSFNDDMNIAVAKSATMSLSFKNVLAWLRVASDGLGDDVVRIEMRGNNGEDLAGRIDIDYSGEAPEASIAGDESQVMTVNVENYVASVDQPKESRVFFYIPVFPRTFSKGFNLKFYNSRGQSGSFSYDKSVTFLRSQRLAIFADIREAVDMGDGQLWATKNVGARTPTDVGSYFAWGETEPKSNYSWSTYKHGRSATSLTKYVLDPSYGTVDGLSVLVPSDDPVSSNWGEDWRTPTISEWSWLFANCDREIVIVDDVTCFRFTSVISGHTSSSILIPVSDYYDGSTAVSDDPVSYYWTSSLNVENSAYSESSGLSLTHDILNGSNPRPRHLGLPVRAVRTQPVQATGIELSDGYIEMELSDTPFTIGSTVFPENSSNQLVIWSCSDESVASIIVNGNVCNVTPVGVGTATITATTADGGFSDSCEVSVTGVPVTGVTLEPSSLTLGPGERRALTATVLPADASVKAVMWSSSDPDAVYVSESGEVVALAENGSSTITATTKNGGFTATCEVTVRYVPVTIVTLNKRTLTLPAGQSETLIATCYPENASNPVIVWSSSDETVATVSFDGTVTANEDCRGGTAIIRASSGSVMGTCTVTVTVPVTEVVLYTDNLSLEVGNTYQLEASVRPIYATNQNIIWSSSNPSVATVDSNGLVEALQDGSATITAASEDGGYTDVCEVTVVAEINGHAYVDLGNGVKWATCNVGADNPWDYGDYFAWGETEPYYNGINQYGYQTWKEGKEEGYAWSSYFDTNDGGRSFITYGRGRTDLLAANDAAAVNWGGSWQMPGTRDWTWLQDNCTWTWTGTYDGHPVRGFIVTSNIPGYQTKSIFLPAAGMYDGTANRERGSYIYYWLPLLHAFYSDLAFVEIFFSGSKNFDSTSRYYGLSIRPVSH